MRRLCSCRTLRLTQRFMGKREGWRWRGIPPYPFTTLVGEQLTRLGARDDAQIQVDDINEFRTRSAEAIESADLGAIFSSEDPANLRVFDTHLDAASKSIANAMTPEWVDSPAQAHS